MGEFHTDEDSSLATLEAEVCRRPGCTDSDKASFPYAAQAMGLQDNLRD